MSGCGAWYLWRLWCQALGLSSGTVSSMAPGVNVQVVVAHGWLSSPAAWGRLAVRLEPSGVSLVPVAGFSRVRPNVRAWADALVERVAACTEPVGVLGHSLGASAALLAAADTGVPVAVLGPSALPGPARRLPSSLVGRVTVWVGQSDVLCFRDAYAVAARARVAPMVLPGVSHGGFLDPEFDALSRSRALRALERAASLRVLQAWPRSPAFQRRQVASAVASWVAASGLTVSPPPASS